jgi:uncharacterized protein (UPF0305 family)
MSKIKYTQEHFNNNGVSKEMEALERLRDGSYDDYHSTSFEDIYHEEFETIKQALTKLEQQEKKDELLTKIKDILALNFSYQEIGIKIQRLFREAQDV